MSLGNVFRPEYGGGELKFVFGFADGRRAVFQDARSK
jgi:hypothetical protein